MQLLYIKLMSLSFENQFDTTTINELGLEEPPSYRVILLNDDFTTKDFVELILVKIFHKTQTEAVKITESVHKQGKGIVGVYPFDIAATRIEIVHSNARANGFPLRCIMEKV